MKSFTFGGANPSYLSIYLLLGLYAHRQINYYAVFLLPPEMLIFYKKHISFISEHAVDPDKRRYLIAAEGPGIILISIDTEAIHTIHCRDNGKRPLKNIRTIRYSNMVLFPGGYKP
jgi:hypothetical protein